VSLSVITPGNVAVITGAASGIGLGLARACLNRGMAVMMADNNGDQLAREAGSLNGELATAECDVRDRDNLEQVRDQALHRFGRIDLVCNNAGIGLTKPLTDTDEVEQRLLFDINVGGVLNGIATFLPVLIEQGSGHLNATSSLSGLVSDADLSIYNGTKFAVVGIMESLALELHRDHPALGCSLLCPGPVATNLLDRSAQQLREIGSDSQPDAQTAAYLQAGLAPDEVGEFAIDGISNGDFWLLPHADYTLKLLEERLMSIRERRLGVPEEWSDYRT